MSDVIMAFSLGLLSAPHCIAMCGSIASALLLNSQRMAVSHDAVQQLRFTTAAPSVPAQQGRSSLHDALILGMGKLFSYVLLGALAGAGSAALNSVGSVPGSMLRGFSALLMIAIGLYIAGWWQGLALLEAAGAKLWQPLLRGFAKANARLAGNPLFAGAVWGLLPCGIVYSMLGLALASGSAAHGAALMASFGLGTLPFVLSTGGLLQVFSKFLADRRVRRGAGVIMILMGFVTLALLSAAHTGMAMSHASH